MIGYLARQAGHTELARTHLARAAEWHRQSLENRRRVDRRGVSPVWEAWVTGLEEDAGAA